MELTKEYFDEQIQNLLSKKDAERFATKDELLELATKGDIGAVRSDIAEVKNLVDALKRTEHEDTTAALRDIISLKRRVSALERPTSR